MLTLGPEWLTIILFGSLVLLLLLGLPLVFAIGGVATLFIILLWGPHALPILANRTYMAMDMFLLVAVPMFIFMGAMLQRCGIAEDMYDLMYHWMGGLRLAVRGRRLRERGIRANQRRDDGRVHRRSLRRRRGQ
jgi:TRAP-type mannitol/chloroaromatic compound transport system permease large subunit